MNLATVAAVKSIKSAVDAAKGRRALIGMLLFGAELFTWQIIMRGNVPSDIL